MINSAVRKLTFYYLLIITFLCLSISTILYFYIVKNSTDFLKQEEYRLEKRFNNNDPRLNKKITTIEENLNKFKTNTIIYLLILNILIINIVGYLAYLFAKKTINPIEENIRRQKDFISNVSHELKTPLTALKSTFEVSLRDKNANFKETLNSGIEEVDKMNTLIDQFMRLSILDSRKFQVKKENLYLDNILKEILNKNKIQVDLKRIQITKNLKFNQIYSDKFLIQELLSIILDNSIKFNKDDGFIDISTIKVRGKDCILIRDSGFGIKKENINRIFERFYKEENSRTKGSGYGIGLSLAREIALLLDCEIEVKSIENKETVFLLKFSALFKN